MLVIFGASKAGCKLYDGSVRKSIMRHYQWIIYIYIYHGTNWFQEEQRLKGQQARVSEQSINRPASFECQLFS